MSRRPFRVGGWVGGWCGQAGGLNEVGGLMRQALDQRSSGTARGVLGGLLSLFVPPPAASDADSGRSGRCDSSGEEGMLLGPFPPGRLCLILPPQVTFPCAPAPPDCFIRPQSNPAVIALQMRLGRLSPARSQARLPAGSVGV